MLEQISSSIIHLIQSAGYLGIFILMTLESALIPIPSEITMPFSGFLVSQGKLNFWFVVLIGAFGNLIGSLIAYGIGFYLEEHVIVKWVKKYGKFLLITEHEYELSLRWLRKYGESVAFFSRILPAVRTFISLPSGLSEMNIWKFFIYIFIGSFIWSFFLTYIGFYFQSRWNVLEQYFRKFDFLILCIIVILALLYLNHKLKIFKRKNN